MSAKKKTVAKKKVAKEPAIEMVSYSMRMVIPTGEYANIQPEIVVKAGTMEEAHAYIAPHMNKLWKEYFNISKRRLEPEIKPETPVQPATAPQQAAPATTGETAPVPPSHPTANQLAPEEGEQSPVSSVALTKATQAVQSCLSIEALRLIVNQVKASVKLTEEDKVSLTPLIMEKEKELGEL